MAVDVRVGGLALSAEADGPAEEVDGAVLLVRVDGREVDFGPVAAAPPDLG